MANLQTSITSTYAQPAVGTTAQRPGSPSAGAMRYNTDLKYTEIYNGSAWTRFAHSTNIKNHADVVTSSGQHITYQHDVYKVHQFVGTGLHTFTPRYTGTVEVLCIAGGGGGGRHSGGGGGAGGVVYNSSYAVTAGQAYTVTVGVGGNGGGNAGQRYGTDSYDQFGTRGCASAFGPSLVTNGDFGSATGWTAGAQWSVTGGQAVKSGSDTSYLTSVPTTPFVQGQIYCATCDIVSGSGSNLLLVNHNDAGYTMPQVSNANVDVAFSISGGKAWAFWKQNGVNLNLINLYSTAAVTLDNLAIFAVSSSLASVGGGYGASGGQGAAGSMGGSGGGNARNQGSGGAGYSSQGYAGGTASIGSGGEPNYPGAGGGGAGGQGGSANTTRGGDGGPGLAFSISGKSKWYAGGGAGNIQYNSYLGGTGGAGGGGNGAPAGAGSGTATLLGGNGDFWTGSGGGGSHYDATFGSGYYRWTQANGASGTVIVRYLSVNPTQVVQIFSNTGQIGNGEATYYWYTPSGVSRAEVLCLAGGGGGGTANASSGYGGGGGAGGLLYHQSYQVANGYPYPILAGLGGGASSNGTNSTIQQSGGTAILTAVGGGAGASTHQSAGSAGGSGGGGSTSNSAGGAGTSGQGYAGGSGNQQASGDTGCGGGGGAGGGGGGSGANNNGPNSGGPGVMYGITGEPVYYGCGGTGSAFYSGPTNEDYRMNTGGTNGSVGYHPSIGTGPISSTINNNAVNLTGSGGSGGRNSGDPGGVGGSGIVVLRWHPVQS
jgi:hypothetical protein